MKTTVELPDALLREVKAYAHANGSSMRELMIDALTRELERRAALASTTPDFVFPTFNGNGLQAGVEPAQFRELAYTEPAE